MSRSDQVSIAEPCIGEEEINAVDEVLESGQLAANGTVKAFENSFARYCNSSHGIATSNGTTALHAALTGLGIGPGDTVLTTPFTFVASANAIRLTGATPIFADINPSTYNLDPASVRATIDSHQGKVDAILAVHLYGLPAPLDELSEIAGSHDIPLIEDCAQAHGAEFKNQPVGSIGDVGCFSFYPTKNMTTGEGGMIVTDQDEVSESIREFIDHGRSGTYEHVTLGHNFRLTDIAAAIGCVQLERLPSFVEKRRQNAERLTAGLDDTNITTPVEPDGYKHAYHQYTIHCANRDELQHYLDDAGIGTGVYYPTPVHKQPAYDGTTCDAPVAEQVSNHVLSLPVHPSVSMRNMENMISTIRSYES